MTVIEKTKEKVNNRYKWRCRCDCGNEILVTAHHLKDGNTMSCGCQNSRGEKKIQSILSKINIKYIQQKTFEKCRNPKTNKILFFDFYLPDYNTCIEYDGQQHFEYTNIGWMTKEKFDRTKFCDEIKNNFCKNNDIRLIRIPYYDFDKIDEQYLLSALGKAEK